MSMEKEDRVAVEQAEREAWARLDAGLGHEDERDLLGEWHRLHEQLRHEQEVRASADVGISSGEHERMERIARAAYFVHSRWYSVKQGGAYGADPARELEEMRKHLRALHEELGSAL